MAITHYEYVTIQAELLTADAIIWRRYRVRTPGIVEALFDANPQIARSGASAASPFLPQGMQIRIPIDPDILAGRPKPLPISAVWSANPLL